MEIVYNSFDGRFSDSPRALYEALASRPGTSGARHTWLAGRGRSFPAGVRTAPPDGPEAVAALERADLVVSNTHLVPQWRKSGYYLQTWHGTPIKRVAADEHGLAPGAPVPGHEDIARWDALVSPNRASTERLRGAFRYDGEVVETGYPRNDALSGGDAGAVRRRVRRSLGLADATTAVLYAPTWRDDVVDVDGGRGVDLQLDATALARRLGPGHALLLRLHPMLSDRLAGRPVPGAVDVSRGHDAAELYLAADVLVTDYSSAMVDFAVTGKPVLVFAYDLERYGGAVRGLYVDLRADAPGPVLTTSAEVVEALADLPTVVRGAADRYRRFRTAYCSLEDGGATARVVEHLRTRPGRGPGGLLDPSAGDLSLAGAR